MSTINSVLTIPKDKIDIVADYLKMHSVSNTNPHIIICAKTNSVTFNFFRTGKLVLQGLNKNSVDEEKNKIVKIVFTEDEKLILGFDEVGRSELNGPFVITGTLGYNKDLLELRDSKKTSDIEKAKAKADEKSLGNITFTLNPALIDNLRGNNNTLNRIEDNFIIQIQDLCKKIGLEFDTVVDGSELNGKNDGITYMPKADDKVPVVASASIIAKSIRDNSKNKDKRKTWNIKELD